MKKVHLIVSLLFLIIPCTTAMAQNTCVNADFSTGDFTGWQGSTGENNNSGVYSNIVNGIVAGTPNSLPSTSGAQTIMNLPATDPNTGGLLSVIPYTGGSSCRLGNDIVSACPDNNGYPANPKAQRLSYTYTVTSANCIFTYQYAIVLQDPGASHSAIQRPKFNISVLNSSGIIIDTVCGEYNVTANSGLPGFQTATAPLSLCSSENIVWKDWTSVSIDLSSYINQSVTIQFTTYDCTLGGHFGYAYISCYCGSLELTQTCSGMADVITAPAGFLSYQWISNGSTIGTGNPLTIPNPVYGDTVKCTCISATGCNVTLDAVLQFQLVNFTLNSPTICSGDSATITANAVGAYSYLWSPGGQITPSITVSPATTTAYTVSVSSAGGCSGSKSTIVTVNPLPNETITTTPTNCNQSNGTITVHPNIGTSPFHYIWNTPNADTTQTVTGLTAGVQDIVTVTDANGCFSSVFATISNIPGPTITGVVTNESCAGYNNGSIITTASGTNGPVTYLWNGGATTPNLTNITSGVYTVTITDSVNCSASASFNVGTHPQFTLTATSTIEHCSHSDGTATAIPIPAGNYQYAWNTMPPKYVQTVTNLSAITYTVTVTDGFCSATTPVTVVNEAGPSVAIVSVTNGMCGNGGGAVAQAIGGFPGYAYTWSTPIPQYGPILSNVPIGNYTITVKDTQNCVATNTVTITSTPVPTAVITNSIPSNCGYKNGMLVASAYGGTPGYHYLWNYNTQHTDTLKNVPTGYYTVTVTDANTCTGTATGFVNVLPGPTVTTSFKPEICDRHNGTANCNPAGGIDSGYTYIWSNGKPTQSISNLSSDTSIYTVTVSDGGCSCSASVKITNIDGPKAAFTVHPKVLTIMDGPVSFFDESSGTIVTWEWELGDSSTSSITQFLHQYQDTGTYYIKETVIDTNGCTDIARDVVVVKDIFTFYVPNAFTPSGDGLNDYFYPQGVNWDPNYFEMYIFDRWGNLIFKSFDQKNDKWNGTVNNQGKPDEAIIDVYDYLIRVKELYGPKHQYIGRVTILK